jgi:hypothetical protein
MSCESAEHAGKIMNGIGREKNLGGNLDEWRRKGQIGVDVNRNEIRQSGNKQYFKVKRILCTYCIEYWLTCLVKVVVIEISREQ